MRVCEITTGILSLHNKFTERINKVLTEILDKAGTGRQFITYKWDLQAKNFTIKNILQPFQKKINTVNREHYAVK